MLAAIQATNLKPAIFVEATFVSTTVYMWSGVGNITWNGHTWIGLGALLSVAVSEDAATVEARGITITLSGLNASLLADSLSDFGLGLPVRVYVGLYSDDTLIDNPITTWSGRTDQPSIDVSGETCTIAINCESRLLDMNIPSDRRLTLEDSQMDYPGDLGLQFVLGLQECTLFWGHYPASSANV